MRLDTEEEKIVISDLDNIAVKAIQNLALRGRTSKQWDSFKWPNTHIWSLSMGEGKQKKI